MAVERIPYKDINQVMQGMRRQIIDSLDYCVNELPKFDNPEQLFKFCRLQTVYHKDPHGVELLQSVPTMVDNNYWGIPWAGDCDCMTILTVALCIANGCNGEKIDNYRCARGTRPYRGDNR